MIDIPAVYSKSKLRKPGPVLLDPKYDGARVSRKKLFEDESDEDDREEEEKSERDSLSGSGDEEGGIRFEDMDEMDIVTGAGESDEEIDSDMAFGESDVEKERFSSYKFSGSSTTKNGIVPKKGHKVTVDSDEEEEESEGDDDGGSEEESEDERRPSRKPANGKVEDEDSDEYDDGEDEDDADGDESDDDEEREAVHRAKLRKMVAEEQKYVPSPS